jgi:hypothetical protein
MGNCTTITKQKKINEIKLNKLQKNKIIKLQSNIRLFLFKKNQKKIFQENLMKKIQKENSKINLKMNQNINILLISQAIFLNLIRKKLKKLLSGIISFENLDKYTLNNFHELLLDTNHISEKEVFNSFNNLRIKLDPLMIASYNIGNK